MSKTPLAGRPPFAIDDDDVKYDTPGKTTRRAAPPVDDPNKRTSAYNSYDNYLDKPDANNRDSVMSGHGAIGGLMGGSLSDDDDSDDDEKPAPRVDTQGKSKNQALFEAAVTHSRATSPTSQASHHSPPPAYQASPSTAQTYEKRKDNAPTQPTATDPRSQRSMVQDPRMATSSPAPPAPLNIQIPPNRHAAPQPQHPQPAFIAGPGPAQLYPPPSPYQQPLNQGLANSPIQPAFIGPSQTPIQPAFLKWGPNTYSGPNSPLDEKASSIGHGGPSSVGHDSIMPIMRGNTEETLLVKSRGPGVGPRMGVAAKRDGDDFWRRFSMVAKRDKALPVEKRSSPWLKKTVNRGQGFSKWVWVIGVFFLLVVVGGSVSIWWFTRSNPDHQVPVTLGGGASQSMTNTNPDREETAAAGGAATTKNNRPLITGTATFGTDPIKDKRSYPTGVADILAINPLPLTTPAPVVVEGISAHKRALGKKLRF